MSDFVGETGPTLSFAVHIKIPILDLFNALVDLQKKHDQPKIQSNVLGAKATHS